MTFVLADIWGHSFPDSTAKLNSLIKKQKKRREGLETKRLREKTDKSTNAGQGLGCNWQSSYQKWELQPRRNIVEIVLC